MSNQSASIKSILFAFLANLGIAITKTIAAVVTGSGAMLAESIHSFADCGNQTLLFLGLKAAKKKPNAQHPLGYGMEIFFWSFIRSTTRSRGYLNKKMPRFRYGTRGISQPPINVQIANKSRTNRFQSMACSGILRESALRSEA